MLTFADALSRIHHEHHASRQLLSALLESRVSLDHKQNNEHKQNEHRQSNEHSTEASSGVPTARENASLSVMVKEVDAERGVEVVQEDIIGVIPIITEACPNALLLFFSLLTNSFFRY